MRRKKEEKIKEGNRKRKREGRGDKTKGRTRSYEEIKGGEGGK